MKLPLSSAARRSAAILPLSVLLIIPLFGMVAFAVDIGYIIMTYAQLQNAADSAALAGAEPLMNGYVEYWTNYFQLQQGSSASITSPNDVITNAEATATQNAIFFAKQNNAGGVNNLVLNSGDIEFGFTDGSGNYSTTIPATATASGYNGYPNTIKVLMRRDSSANGALNLFFGPVLGTSSTNVERVAAATIYLGTANLTTPPTSTLLRILPMTYDVNAWNYFMANGVNYPDPNAYVQADIYSGSLSNAKSNAAEITVYGQNTSTQPGNFGLLSLDRGTTDNGSNGAKVISDWIQYGVSNTDLANEYNATPHHLLPLSTHYQDTYTSPQPDWLGNPGIKADDVKALHDYGLNQTYLMPLFEPVVAYDIWTKTGAPNPITLLSTSNTSTTNPNAKTGGYSSGTGQGSNALYYVVKFVAVTITVAVQGSKTVEVQPSSMVLPDSVFDSPQVAGISTPGNASQIITTFAAPKLTNPP